LISIVYNHVITTVVTFWTYSADYNENVA